MLQRDTALVHSSEIGLVGLNFALIPKDLTQIHALAIAQLAKV